VQGRAALEGPHRDQPAGVRDHRQVAGPNHALQLTRPAIALPGVRSSPARAGQLSGVVRRRGGVMRSTSPLRVLLLLAPAVVLSACQPPAGRVAPPADHRDASPGWELVWADEFDVDGRPNPSNWTYEIGFVRNEELQWYQPENAVCEN